MGNTIKARLIGNDIVASIRHFVGGELVEYTELMSASREEVVQRMAAEAKQLKAKVIVDMRFTTADVMEGAAEILAYGTDVKVKAARK